MSTLANRWRRTSAASRLAAALMLAFTLCIVSQAHMNQFRGQRTEQDAEPRPDPDAQVLQPTVTVTIKETGGMATVTVKEPPGMATVTVKETEMAATVTVKETEGTPTSTDGQRISTSAGVPLMRLPPTIEAFKSQVSAKPPCSDLPGASDVLVVLKTGASEIYEKLPAHFLTTFQCAPDYLIYSDLEQDIGPHHVHDALANVTESVKAEHRDFELYRELVRLKAEGQDMAQLKGDKSWDLDKWKFLPMVVDAARRHPEKKWFVFVEADTYLNWANTLAWLARMDSSRKLYIGCQVMIGDTVFGHGGSAFVLSGAAAKRMLELEVSQKTRWEEKTGDDCCGDKLLAEALLDDGVELTGAFPMIQGHTPSSLDWSKLHWCSPVISWHHMSANEIDSVWQMEQKWIKEKQPSEPLLFSHVYQLLIHPHIRTNRSEWDNLSDDQTITINGAKKEGEELTPLAAQSHGSIEACRAACNENPDCLQYAWLPGECRLSRVIKFGKPAAETKESNNKKSMVSGWLTDRMASWMQDVACKEGGNWILDEEG